MIRRRTLETIVNRYLATLCFYINIENQNTYFDVNKYAEGIICDLLNTMYDIELINLNIEKYNYPAVDLGDYSHRIAYQVTSSGTTKKLKHTIQKFLEHGLGSKFDYIGMIVLGRKSVGEIELPEGINIEVIDLDDICRIIGQVNDEKLLEIKDCLQKKLNLQDDLYDKDIAMFEEFKNSIGDLVYFFAEHDVAIMPTHLDILDKIKKEILYWGRVDKKFCNDELENSKDIIIRGLDILYSYLSNHYYFRIDQDGLQYIQPIKDPERKIFNEMYEATVSARKMISDGYCKICKQIL